MKLEDWLKPGIKVKRWTIFGIFGVLLIAFGFTELVNKRLYDFSYKIFYIFLIVFTYEYDKVLLACNGSKISPNPEAFQVF